MACVHCGSLCDLRLIVGWDVYGRGVCSFGAFRFDSAEKLVHVSWHRQGHMPLLAVDADCHAQVLVAFVIHLDLVELG